MLQLPSTSVLVLSCFIPEKVIKVSSCIQCHMNEFSYGLFLRSTLGSVVVYQDLRLRIKLLMIPHSLVLMS
jgi:hypothetical protein